MRVIFLFLITLLPLEVFAQRDSIIVYFLGHNKIGERYRVYYENNLMLDVKTSHDFIYSFKIPKDTSLRSDMDAFRSIRVSKRSLFGYQEKGPSTAYLDRKYLVIKRDPKYRRKFSVDYFWTNEKPLNGYWRP